MENFHPLHQTPSHADALNLEHCSAEVAQDCTKLGAPYILPNLLCPFFNYFENFVDLFCNLNFVGLFLATFLIFADLFCIFGHFLHLFGLLSLDMCAVIPLCANNSATRMCSVKHKPYYAGRSPKFLVQSRHCARHIRHNMYFFQSGSRLFPVH